MKLEKIITREQNFADWYTSVIQAAKLVDYTSIKGMMIFQPNGWAIWQNIMHELDRRLKTKGIKNVQLPLFIKYSEFLKEKEHVEGFAPELFLVTQQGNKKLEEPYVVRPTSEIAFCNYFKKIVSSYSELPIKYNQWCNVYRVEKNTRPFLRNSEFFWQEMHSIHENKDDAIKTSTELIELYKDFVNYFLCIPVLMGEKTEGERFAGAENTYTIEALMQDGQALQCGTSHYLAQNFSKTFDIKFQNKNNQYELVHQTSAGMSTRIIGAVIMTHADDKGLVLPVGIAPTQIALLPIFADKEPRINGLIKTLHKDLHAKYRVEIDETNNGFGFKIANQEVQGTPIILVVGPKDAIENNVTLIRRDNGQKITVALKNIVKVIDEQVHAYQISIYQKANDRLNSSIIDVHNLEEFNNAIQNKKIAKAAWGGSLDDEKLLKEQTGATPRCILSKANNERCFFTNKSATHIIYFARAY
ncbi:MAG: proline--tRNA ligase [Mycoplasmataceae bacterium]|nr:proline--tRNA ligase [Mycoplasmataceae bacterium]